MFIAFEGGDGAGKSTQVRRLAERLTAAGHAVLTTREPGGTPVGERLRSLVLEHGDVVVDARTESLIFAAARAAHVEQVIRPALAAGRDVVTDRYVDSSIAYQGAGRGLGSADVEAINAWATGGLQPDLTILLDVDPRAGRDRRAGRAPEDRMESEPDDFHTVIRQTFLHRAATSPDRYLVLDGTLPVGEIAARVGDAVLRLADGSLPDVPDAASAAGRLTAPPPDDTAVIPLPEPGAESGATTTRAAGRLADHR
ncbi:dTMP kinase [Tersicoccus solisilvae]|uniref:dTMP kinase n=1 Tax=Tersicoccus solisilvae TaxID=1882339 RepID=UPI0016641C5D|nr:dTMP kinase [Tersicoccus solisilvae]